MFCRSYAITFITQLAERFEGRLEVRAEWSRAVAKSA